MSKPIRVSDETWEKIEELRRKHETKGEAVARLVAVYEGMSSMRDIIGGVKAYGEFLDTRREKESTQKP